MPNKYDVIELNKKHPDWTARQISQVLRCCDGYVNATAQRNGLKIAKYVAKGPKRSRISGDPIWVLGRAARDAGLIKAAMITALMSSAHRSLQGE